jgi:2-oxo-4-hydroxy-4-carboxy-5-ureidoimidazoline decarboxylase
MSPETLAWLNSLAPDEAAATLRRSCGSGWWAQRVAASLPVDDAASLLQAAEVAFDAMSRDAWFEALTSHPRIGDFASLKMKYAGNREWSAGEQSGAAEADDATLHRLAQGNNAYEARFGYLFVVCATGKSAAQMLAILEERMKNEATEEFAIACGEQRKITRLRLDKLERDKNAECGKGNDA